MIVKSKSKGLQQLIQRLNDYVAEIILVFTTGKDVKYDFVNEKIRSYFYPLKKDFSQARNFSIRKATCPWIFVIDDDEFVNPDNLWKLRKFICSDDIAGYCFVRYDYIGNLGWDIKLPCRLFRNNRALRYDAPIYEEVTPSILQQNLNVETIWKNFPVHHFAHSISYHELQGKFRFYRDILLEKMKRNPGDIHQKQICLWQIAMLWADSNDFNKAIYLIQKSAQLCSSWHPSLQLILFDATGLLFAIGQLDKALLLLNELRLSNIRYKMGRYFYFKILNRIGLIYSILEKYKKAIEFYQQAIDTGIPSAAVYANLGLAQNMQGDIDNAQKKFAKALEINPFLTKIESCENTRIWKHRLHTDVRLKVEHFQGKTSETAI